MKPVISHNKRDRFEDYAYQFNCICKKHIQICPSHYIYPLDEWVIREVHTGRIPIVSNTVDFSVVLKSDLNGLVSQLDVESSFCKVETQIIESIIILKDRILSQLSFSADSRSQVLKVYFEHLLYRQPESLDEAVQKLLFYDALFWQMNHRHVGLGRLDDVLYEYYCHDIEKGVITRSDAKAILVEMCKTLGKDTMAKSQVLPGDTGQYIMLGGIDKNGNTIQNELTEMFLECFTEHSMMDPKIILRVNKDTSDLIWEKSIRCIIAGNGTLLLMNEKNLLANMVAFGYSKDDVYQLGTSACWEPLIIGKSFDQNNSLISIIALQPLNDLILDGIEPDSFEELVDEYKRRFAQYIEKSIYDLRFDCSPLYSLFFDDCLKNQKDYTDGGARYSYHGVQVVSFPNLINSLLNLKCYLYGKRMLTFEDCREAIRNDFINHEDFVLLLKSNEKQFGSPSEEVVSLTNELMEFVSSVIEKTTVNGQKVKVGFSSPSYISASQHFAASIDGRHAGDPFAVHISPVSSKIDFPAILEFASKLDYSGNRLNGNVVDFIVPSSFVKQPGKLMSLIKSAFDNGIFELQLSVLDKNVLIEAKKHPEKYPNLIVRVWGFNAYFNDLPEEYKDNLINRAVMYEDISC